jgi:hypothetical protein
MILAKVKVKLSLSAMKAFKGSRSVAPSILNLSTSCRRVVEFVLRLLFCQVQNTPVTITTEAR